MSTEVYFHGMRLPLATPEAVTADKGDLVERLETFVDHGSANMADAQELGSDALLEMQSLRTRLAEHESNQRAYEAIIGKKTCQEVAEELAVLQARGDLAVQNRNHWQAEAESMGTELASARKALEEITSTTALLQQNSVACCQFHHGIDTQLNGLPGWLANTQAAIERAQTALKDTK